MPYFKDQLNEKNVKLKTAAQSPETPHSTASQGAKGIKKGNVKSKEV
jgi:hypothetical protein